jgi:2-methylaconitate isomerase
MQRRPPATPGQIRIPATYMRGGTSKGVFFRRDDLPAAARNPGPVRDALLLRVIGSPDPYGKHTDGMGGATSSTSKTVILSRSERPEHDVDYLFGQVAIDRAFVDWSGNCGNLTAAVGAFAIRHGLIDPGRVPVDGRCTVRIWQVNIGKTIIASIPMAAGEVVETGEFELDGVAFPSAEIELAFVDPADAGEGALLPTGRVVDRLDVPGVGCFDASMINAGIPTVFLRAADLGYRGTELQEAINSDPAALGRLERIRAQAAVRMGLIGHPEAAVQRQHTPKLAFVAEAGGYVASSGREVAASEIDLLVRAMSMGKLHHAMMGTAAVAIAAAAAVPGTLVAACAGAASRADAQGRVSVRFGHPSGTLKVGAEAVLEQGQWRIRQVLMSRSARRLMDGGVWVPGAVLRDIASD